MDNQDENGRAKLRRRRNEAFRKMMELGGFSRNDVIDNRINELLDELFECGCELRDRDKYLGK